MKNLNTMKKLFYCLLTLTIMISNSIAQELVIGEERVEPGIVLIFEGAIKDLVVPESNNLSIDQTNVHIEARVNWDSTNIPDGTPPGGFVPYLKISSIIFNENSSDSAKFLTSYMKPRIPIFDDYKGDHWIGKSHESNQPGITRHSFKWIEKTCNKRGLSVTNVDSDLNYRAQIWLLIEKN